MNKLCFYLLGVIIAALPPSVPAQERAVRTVALPYLKVEITLVPVSNPPDFVLRERFSTNDPKNHNVFCISGLRDVRYNLRDSSGKTVSLATNAFDHADVRSGGGMWNPEGPLGPDPCKAIKDDQAYRSVVFSWLYPNLKPGRYSLQIVLAPRGNPDRATTAPFSITIH